MIVAYIDRLGYLRCHICHEAGAEHYPGPFYEVHHDAAPHNEEPCEECGRIVGWSLGHVRFHEEWEFFWDLNGDLYRAPRRNPLELNGYRQGARFECVARKDNHRRYLAEVYGIEV